MGFLDVEVKVGGIIIYALAFTLFAVPFLIWLSEDIQRKRRSFNKLPKVDPSIPTPPPTKITEIRVYPIKSCRGIQVSQVKLLKTGLDLDRQWMFVDAEKLDFLTIRQNSEMTLIHTAITQDDQLKVSIQGKGPECTFTVPAHPTKSWLNENTTLGRVTIWGQTVDGHIYSEELTKPFSDFFGQKVRFVLKGPTSRELRGNAAPEILGRKQTTKFADLMPVQVSNQKSIDELNARLSQQGHKGISIERFRPNIVIEGDEAWSEDTWKTVQIGPEDESESESDDEHDHDHDHEHEQKYQKALIMDVAARCARCQVPNVDPDTAVKDKKQPWDTLMSYRRIDKGITFKPCFGMLCLPRSEGVVRVGMPFEVIEQTSEHLYIKGM